jgi:hypothetical protein
MTAAYNLSQLANKVNSAGQIDVSTALSVKTWNWFANDPDLFARGPNVV